MLTGNIVNVPIVANVEKQIVGSSLRRRRLVVTADIATAVYLRTTSLGNVAGGLALQVGAGRMELTLADHGDLVFASLWAFTTAAGGANIGVLEVIA